MVANTAAQVIAKGANLIGVVDVSAKEDKGEWLYVCEKRPFTGR